MALRVTANKPLSNHNGLFQARAQMRLGQRRQGINIGCCTTVGVVRANDAAGVKPAGLRFTLTKDLGKQQGRHQLTVADQFITQRGGWRSGRRLRQVTDIVEEIINFLADNGRLLQAGNNIVLDST